MTILRMRTLVWFSETGFAAAVCIGMAEEGAEDVGAISTA